MGWPRWLATLVAFAVLSVLGAALVTRFLHGALVSTTTNLQSLRIITWNIGKIYLSPESRAADRDLGHVAQVIAEVEPQIVALQEIRDSAQLSRLLAALGSGWSGRVPSDQYDRRAALLTQLPARFIEFKTSTGRTAQGAEVQLPGGSIATVTAVHLDAFDEVRRARQIEEVLASVERLANDEVILLGDFNFDPAAVARNSADHRLYSYITRDLVDAGRHAGGTSLSAHRLDYVFYRSSRVHWTRAEVLRERRINIMDHDPLVVEMALKAYEARRAK
jgi:endonuclease/exonuclease/phosphatase family metal-dependent hydrolase